MPAVAFPDVVLLACQFLRANLAWLAPVTVGHDVPSSRPPRLVTVARDGGPQVGPTGDLARLRVNVWSPTAADAESLALKVSSVLRSWPDGDPVCRVQQTSGPSGVPEAEGARRLMYFDVLVRGS